MNWTNKYVGIPFQKGGRNFQSCDCGGLVLLVLKEEKGIIATDFNGEYINGFNNKKEGLAHVSKHIEAVIDEWIIVEIPKPFDMVRFSVGKMVPHVGIIVKWPYCLHIEESVGIARIENLNDKTGWGKRIFEYRRHKELI